MDDAELCADFFKALADPIRLHIVKALQTGPMTVSDIALLLDLELQKASHHLRVLYRADLLTLSRDGRYAYYELNKKFCKSARASSTVDLGCCTIDLSNT